jgi:cob(I)alamin adenosyltransferase
VVAVHEGGKRPITTHTLAYLNRLSSLLFALARYANHVDEVQEEAPTYR